MVSLIFCFSSVLIELINAKFFYLQEMIDYRPSMKIVPPGIRIPFAYHCVKSMLKHSAMQTIHQLIYINFQFLDSNIIYLILIIIFRFDTLIT